MGIMLRAKFVALALALGLVALAPAVSFACASADVSAIERGTRFDTQIVPAASLSFGAVSAARSGR